MAIIEFARVTKVFEGGAVAVDALDLVVTDGEFLVLVGPSGCGKSTSLRMLAGLEDVTDGEISIDGVVVNELPSKKRDTAMVFQNYALYPHMSVAGNMGFGLKLRKLPKAEIGRRVRQTAGVLDLVEYLDRLPKQLSGGQRQRVAMGRAIVREPHAFLMDEPLSNLDAKLRVQMRSEVSRLQRRLGVTTVYVTHDQTEALTMGDRVAVMRKGVLQQVATPQELYDRPVNLFVAGFIGSPAMNLLEAGVEADGDELRLHLGSNVLHLDAARSSGWPALRARAGGRVAIGIRPEDLDDAAVLPDASAGARITVPIELVESVGSDVFVHAALDATPVRTEDLRELAADIDVGLGDGRDGIGRVLVVGRCDPRTRLREGTKAELAVDLDRLYAFDLDTGATLARP